MSVVKHDETNGMKSGVVDVANAESSECKSIPVYPRYDEQAMEVMTFQETISVGNHC